MKNLFKPIVLLLVLAVVLTGCGGKKDADQDVIKVGSDMTYAPFEYIDPETKEPAGFDIELMLALGEAMGKEIEFVNTSWDGLIPGLNNGDYDLLISAMTITAERAESIDFSDPYFTTGQVIVVKKGTTGINGPEDLAGKVVSVQIGTTGQFEAEKIPGIKRIDTFPTMPEAYTALKQGKVDASVADELTALAEIKANPDGVEIVGGIFTAEDYGIGIKKGRKDNLLKEVNEALKKVKEDGTYDKIYEKWITNAQGVE
ncbi:MAG TPA: basic amino acid ABC transporter substrate-binding protein [Firmicutes bacterium]|jgi:polar amino acid transport system substrate-binding protein|nr:basic amino acid ABC transporter substrate-binding protein [Bacillota bacterium]